MKKIKVSMVIKQLLKRYKGLLLLQWSTFAILMIMFMTWEPLVMKGMFQVIETGDIGKLTVAFTLVAAGILVMFVIGYLNNTYVDMISWKIINQECEEGLRQLPNLCYDGVNRDFSEGGIFERIFSIGQARFMICTNVIRTLIYIAVMCILLGSTLPQSPLLYCLVLLVLVMQFILLLLRSKKAEKYEKKYKYAEEESNGYASHIINDLSFIVMNQLEEAENHEYEEIRKKAFLTLKKQQFFDSLFQSMEEYILIIVKAIMGFWIFPLFMGSGFVTAAFTSIDKLKIIWTGIAESITDIKKKLISAERYETMAAYGKSLPEDTHEENNLLSFSKAGLNLGGKQIFSGRSLRVDRGEKIAVIGSNGSGKSSLMKVMAGLYHITEGKFERKSGCRIAYIPAKVNLFDGTGRENILMAADETREEDFWFCRSFSERQVLTLSGGEKQRVNIARGLFREGDLLLADEPTSSLDSDNSYLVMKELVNSSETCVVITHDIALLELFTRIIDLGESNV